VPVVVAVGKGQRLEAQLAQAEECVGIQGRVREGGLGEVGG
jgi:hypothetical protein